MSKPSLLRRVFGGFWNALTRIRLALSNILFLVMLALIYFVYLGGGPEPMPEKAALLLNMSGTVVDERSPVDPLMAILSEPTPAEHEVLLRDVIDAIGFAAEDPSISALVMELDSLVYVGISKSQEIIPALEAFRATGKPIVAVGDYFTQDQYLLASHADTVIAHPLGGVAVEGYSSYQNYFRETLEKISVSMHVFRAGDYKSAVEPYTRDDMSLGEKEVTRAWLSDLWKKYAGIVETERGLDSGALDNYINNYATRLQAAGGDSATLAQQAGLVDELMSRSQSNEYLAELVGATNEEGLYEAVVFERYVARKRPGVLSQPEGEYIAVVTASGNILPGEHPPGTIGGDTLARLIRSTAENEAVKAIVLRVNSGGGSMFASEVIRQQLLYAKEKGIPLVVSMGAVAASGGYYIAADADEIWATPSTITGSIGVFAAFPTFEKLLERMGVRTDGVGTTKLAGSLRIDRPLNQEVSKALNSNIEFAYDTFLEIVAAGRNMTVEQVDAVAQGIVWSSAAAQEVGLVDELGTLEDAIAAAAQLAALENYEVEYVSPPLSPRDMLLKQLANRTGGLGLIKPSAENAVVQQLLEPVKKAANELSLLQDPRNLYLRCLSCGGVR
ncbi:MAG: signal peptide peptidase SppA [Halioglobus sp.]